MRVIDLREHSRLFAPSTYTELRAQENRTVNIRVLKGNVVGNSRSATAGVSARAYDRGGWGFASRPDLAPEAMASVVREATANAAFLGAKGVRPDFALPVTCATGDSDLTTSKPTIDQAGLVAFVREVDDLIATKYPSLTSRSIGLGCLDMEKNVLTSHGSHFHSMIPRVVLYVGLSSEKDGEPFEAAEGMGGAGQFEDIFTDPAALLPRIDQIYEHLMKKREGVFPEAGSQACVLGTKMAGLLAHEAIGHTVEADWVLGGSVAAGWLGKEVASPHVTLVDFAHHSLGSLCPVPVWIDDEGTTADDLVLIRDGVLEAFMQGKETAARLGMAPTGNARAMAYNNEVEVRMRNTAILPGSASLEDLIASVDDGYYLVDPGNGQADATSEFMFSVTLGYEIKGGKLGRALRDTTVSGLAFDVLKSVSMVSDRITWLAGGFCGKKTLLPVGLGGPAMRCTINIGGR